MVHTTAAPSKFPAPDDLFGPPVLRAPRRARIEQKPTVYLTDAERAYLEGYDATEAYPSHAAAIVQAVFDARNRSGSAPLLIIEAERDARGHLAGACAVADPGPLFAEPRVSHHPKRRRIAGRVAA